MDVIAVDIGNNTVSLGAFTNEELGRTVSLPLQDADRLAHLFAELRESCGEQELGARTVPVVVSCVNPPALALVDVAHAQLGAEAAGRAGGGFNKQNVLRFPIGVTGYRPRRKRDQYDHHNSRQNTGERS